MLLNIYITENDEESICEICQHYKNMDTCGRCARCVNSFSEWELARELRRKSRVISGLDKNLHGEGARENV